MSIISNAVGQLTSLFSGSPKPPLEDLSKPLLLEMPPQQETLASQSKAPKTITPPTNDDTVLQARLNVFIGKGKPADVYDAYMDQL